MIYNTTKIDLSIVIANYNRLDWLQKCLVALGKQNNTNISFEVIVVDDGSHFSVTDFLKNYNASYPFKCIFQKNQGPAVARNCGTKKAQGNYIAYIDNDSIAPPNWLQNVSESIKMIKDNVVGVNGIILPYHLIDNSGSQVASTLEKINKFTWIGKKIYPYNRGNTNNLIYHKEAILKLNGFDESYPYPAFEDADLAFRLAKTNHIIVDNPQMIIYHPNETDWKILKKKFIMHGISVRKFVKKFYLNYPFSMLLILIANFWSLIVFFPIIPFLILFPYNQYKMRFIRSFYTLKGFLSLKINFNSKNS